MHDIENYSFFRELIALPFVEAVYITGSRARGDHDERSDLDLAVACPLATDEQWAQALRISRYNDETFFRIDAIRLDSVTDPVQRAAILHNRKLLYLKTDSGAHALADSRQQFFDVWHTKLADWIAYLPIAQNPSPEQLQTAIAAFHSCFDCIWVLARKCLSVHGMYTNTPLSTFRESYMEGWLENRLAWEQMVQDYRLSKLEQSPEESHALYQRLPGYTELMQRASAKILSTVKPYMLDHEKA